METSKCQPSSSPHGEVLCLGDYLRGKVILYRGKDSAWLIFSENDLQKNWHISVGEVRPETFSILIVDFGGEMVKMIEKYIANCFSKLFKMH